MPEGVAEPIEQHENANGSKPLVARPSEPNERQDESKPAPVKLILERELYLGPQQSKLVTVKMVEKHKGDPGFVSTLMPYERVLAEKRCDFIEELGVDEPLLTLSMMNWGNCPGVIEKDTMIGSIFGYAVVPLCQINGDQLRVHECSEED